MSPREELDFILKLIRKYNLPLSPILEYAINEKCEVLESYSIAQENFSENEVIQCIREQIQSVVSGYNSELTLLVDYDPSKGLVVRKQRPINGVEDTSVVYDNESDVILTHPVDWSPFEYGFTIDKKFHEAIFKAVGKYIPRGSGVDVKIVFHGKVFDAKITNANCQGRKGDTIRLLYKGKNNTLGSYLKEVLPEIYSYIKTFKEQNGGRKQCPLPSDLRKLLVMKRTELRDTFNLLIEAC